MARAQFMVSIEYLTTDAAAADDATLGAWLRLCAKSSGALWRGRYEGAKAWKDDAWVRVAGVRRKAVQAVVASGLAAWEGADLVLAGYDLAGEELWRRKSQGGRVGNERKWSKNANQTPAGTPLSESEDDTEPGDSPGERHGVRSPDRVGEGGGVSDCDSEGVAAARAPAPEPAATALPAGQWTDDTAMTLATLLGAGRQVVDGERTAPQWRNAFTGLTARQVQATWMAHGAPITLPSHFRAARKEIEEAEVEAEAVLEDIGRMEQRRADKDAREKAERVKAEGIKQGEIEARMCAAAILQAVDNYRGKLPGDILRLVEKLRRAVAAGRASPLLVAQIKVEMPADLASLVASLLVVHIEDMTA
jgi:hypothetical protein